MNQSIWIPIAATALICLLYWLFQELVDGTLVIRDLDQLES